MRQLIQDTSPQNSEEWYAARAGVITASGVHKVMSTGRGKSVSKVRRDYMIQLATERLMGRRFPERNVRTYWMDRGHEVEDQARAWYEIKTDQEVEQVGLVYLDEKRQIGCSPDGLVSDREGMMQIKCPKLATHIDYVIKNECPADYAWQLQHEMWVCRMPWNDFVTYHPESHVPGKVIRVHRDDKKVRALQIACHDFLAELEELTEELRNVE